MSEVNVPVARRRGIVKHNILPGAMVGVGILVAAEVFFRVIADGHTDPDVRLIAMALSVAAGAFVGFLRGSGALVVLLAVGLAGAAEAADRSRQYNVTIATAACPTGTPGQLYDGKIPGLLLSGLRAYNVTVCPQSGHTFTGLGGWRACVYRESPGPLKWALAPLFYVDMTDDGFGSPLTSTVANPCLTFWDVELGVNDGDLLYVYPTTSLGVSGGTAVSVYLEGVMR